MIVAAIAIALFEIIPMSTISQGELIIYPIITTATREEDVIAIILSLLLRMDYSYYRIGIELTSRRINTKKQMENIFHH